MCGDDELLSGDCTDEPVLLSVCICAPCFCCVACRIACICVGDVGKHGRFFAGDGESIGETINDHQINPSFLLFVEEM